MPEREISRREATLERLIALQEVSPLLRRQEGLHFFTESADGKEYHAVEKAQIELKSGASTIAYIAGVFSRQIVFSHWASPEGYLETVRSFDFKDIRYYEPVQ